MPQNIAEFRIIGRVGKVNAREKLTYVDVASNYNRQKDGEWETEVYWNSVVCFSRTADRAKEAEKGDLVHVTGSVRQNNHEKDGQTVYSTELIADTFSVLAKASDRQLAE